MHPQEGRTVEMTYKNKFDFLKFSDFIGNYFIFLN